jgi:endonuclease YncB( thermonuclease family)
LKGGALVKPFSIFFALMLCVFAAEPGFPWVDQCVGVVEGDTIKVVRYSAGSGPKMSPTLVNMALYGISCPERGQDFWPAAKKFTNAMVYGKVVEVEPVTGDQYGHIVAWVSVNGKSLNKELLRAGLAWWSRNNAPDRVDLAKQEEEARKAKRGLWSIPNPIPPWEFRRQ